MSTLVSLLNKADLLPLVGSPIGQATTWFKKGNTAVAEEINYPPPYEKVIPNSRLSQLSEYVIKRASFSSGNEATSSADQPPAISPIIMDQKEMKDGLRLLEMAAEMNNSAPVSPESSIHLYMMGLDRVLTSMPINSDPTFKAALESKLMDLTVKYHLTLTSPSTGVKKLSEIQQEEALGGLSDMIIHMAVKGAIALKRSPIPDLMSRLFQMTKASLLKMDESYSIRKRTSNITTFGLAKAMELDEYYEVHQFFAELFYTGCTAVLQASKAYTEESTDDSQLSSIGMNGVMIPSPLRIEQ